jgi:hypothetical protein
MLGSQAEQGVERARSEVMCNEGYSLMIRTTVTRLAVQNLTSVDAVIQQEIVRGCSSMVMFVHCFFDTADTTFNFWVLKICMQSTCRESNFVNAAPHSQRFAHKSIVCMGNSNSSLTLLAA